MSKINNIFCTGTMRTGGSLVANLLSTNKDLIVLTDVVHFFRYIFNRYDPIQKNTNIFKVCRDLSLRLKYRDNIRINSEKIYQECLQNNVNSYGKIYAVIFNHLLKKIKNKKIIAEFANFEWKNIDNFLKFNKKNVAIHVIRDPRAVLASWKKITFSKGYKYLNCIFNWINSVTTYNKLKKKYPKNRYLLIHFEDIHNSPKKQTKILCSFLKIKFQNRMLITSKWNEYLKGEFNFVNQSAYGSKKKIYGFSKKRNYNWEKNLKDWELALVNFLCKKYLKNLRYTHKTGIDRKLLDKGFSILKKDKFLKKRFDDFKKNNQGNYMMLNDPTNPKNWESRIYPGKKFVKTKEYIFYRKEEKKLNNLFKRKYYEKK